MRHKTIRITLYVISVIVALWLLNNIVVSGAAIYLKTAHLKQVFAQQVKLLSGPIASLGITASQAMYFQCFKEWGTTHWMTTLRCQNGNAYRYSFNSPLAPAFQANAVKLDHLLQANGWINDSPHNSPLHLTSFSSVDAVTGSMMSVPFHKNFGGISCNLDIDFGSVDASPLTAATGTLNVNEFDCSERVTFPEINVSIPSYHGV